MVPTGRATDAELRSIGGMVLSLLLAAGVCLLPMIPEVEALLGVGPAPVAIAMGAFVVMSLVGAVVYRRYPRESRAFAVFDRTETAVIQASMLSLVVASGRADSFIWMLWLSHVIILGQYATHVRFNTGLLVLGPCVVAIVFFVDQERIGPPMLALFVGALGMFLYHLGLSMSRRLAAVDAERARLAAELADARVREERERIARDIHDGLGADLAALDWRLRSLRGDAGSELDHEIDELVGRLAHGASELRAIVWALRTPSRRWSEIVAYLRQRVVELGASTARVEITDEGDGGVSTWPGELALDYLRAVLELVHNASRHAQASRIMVVLRASPDHLEAIVEDDGEGLTNDELARSEGGLANLRTRTARASGAFEVARPAGGGTRITIRFAPPPEQATSSSQPEAPGPAVRGIV